MFFDLRSTSVYSFVPFFVLTKINIMIYLGCVVEHQTSLGRACARLVGA